MRGWGQVLRVLALDQPTGMCLADQVYSWPGESSAAQLTLLVQSFFQFARSVEGGPVRSVLMELPESRRRVRRTPAVRMDVAEANGVQIVVFHNAGKGAGTAGAAATAAATATAAAAAEDAEAEGASREGGDSALCTPTSSPSSHSEVVLHAAARELAEEAARIFAAAGGEALRPQWRTLLDEGLDERALAGVFATFPALSLAVRAKMDGFGERSLPK